MADSQLSISDLPILVISKIIKMLESDAILCLSHTCRLFYSMIEHDYLLGLILPLDDQSIFQDIKRKKVLKLKLNIRGTCLLNNTNWDRVNIDVLEIDMISKQLRMFNIKETSEMCINIHFSREVLSPQCKQDYTYLVEMTKQMNQLKKCKISITSNGYEPRMAFVPYMHIQDLLKFNQAKEVVLKLPQIDIENFWTQLSVSPIAEKLVIIGPCKGLIGMKTNIFCQNLREIILKPSSHSCFFSPSDESSLHRNGICVVDVESVLKYNWNVEYYNNVFVGDLIFMKQCCAFNVLAERFYEDYKNCGGKMGKHGWLDSWKNYRHY